MMDLKTYVDKVKGLCIDYDGLYGHQCVDLVKHYSQNVLGVKLGSFGGSAKTGWFNKSNTFKKDIFTKVEYKAGLIPEVGDIVFFRTGTPFWHVGIVLKANKSGLEVLEQNMGNGDGLGLDDCVKISLYNYEKVLGWYHFGAPTANKIELSEVEKKLKKAQEFGIWNGKDGEKPASRKEVALMCLKVLEILGK